MTAMRKNWAADPGAIATLRNAMVTGEFAPAEAVDAALTRIAAAEPAVQGWCLIDRESAYAAAERLASTPAGTCGPLHGIPVAIKDVIDVQGWPTRAGSRTRDHAPLSDADATVVAKLRAAGAIVVGKAHTTEFAFFDGPPPTRNPHDLSRTPGGSSAGPAAVVAAGMVPLSLGTQTAGSISRPAAYCGIAAFKPSSLSWPGFGVIPFAPSFDTVGVFGYRVADAALAARALMPDFMAAESRPGTPPRIVVLNDPLLADASPCVAEIGQEVADKLAAAGIDCTMRDSPVSLAALNAMHLLIREYELGRAHAALRHAPDGQVTPSLREAIARGLRIGMEDYVRAFRELAAARAVFWDAMVAADALIFPAAPDIAPKGMATGDARFVVPFTALGGPIVSLPIGFTCGMPLGIMLIGAPGTDRMLLDIAERLAPYVEISRGAHAAETSTTAAPNLQVLTSACGE